MKHEVMVSAVHPVLGRLYWVYESGADCNAADYFSITSHRPSALLLPQNWRCHDHLNWCHKSHLYSVFDTEDHDTDYSVSEDDETGERFQKMTGLLGSLQSHSGQTVEEFRLWLFRANWQDIPKLVIVGAEFQADSPQHQKLDELRA